ncbi:MAG: hypothetical protein APF81_10080 [Desulfosporosinus sp. BRH_c37]|nr:MAG: hypothetical protein APF81_10080 [Desulfosporosinus sp. BRH_c37]
MNMIAKEQLNSESNPIDIMIMVLIIAVCMSGATIIFSYRIYLIWAVALLMLFKSRNRCIYINRSFIVFIILTIWMGLGIIYTQDMVATIKFFSIYLSCCLILSRPFDEKIYLRIMNAFEIIAIIAAISIIISVFIQDMVPNNFMFFLSRTYEQTISELQGGAYSGFIGERSEAAVIMNIALALTWGNYFTKSASNKKMLVLMFILYIALMLTGKRTLFAISVIIPIFFIMVSKQGKRKIYIIGATVVLGIILYLLSTNIDALSNLLLRFQDSDDYLTMNGRERLWEVAINMFKDNPIYGSGIGSYNAIANDSGIRFGNGDLWIYQAHNVYYQIFAETGIIGGTIYLSLLSSVFISAFKLFKRLTDLSVIHQKMLYFVIYMQLLISIYGFTGNWIYYPNQIMIQVVTLSMMIFLIHTYKGKLHQ